MQSVDINRFVFFVMAIGLVTLVGTGCSLTDSDSDRAFEETVWRLEAFLAQDAFPTMDGSICTRGGVSCVDDSRTYTVTFRDDGNIGMQADCNTCGGSYARAGTALDVEGIVCTEIACGTGSRGSAFAVAVGSARAYSIRGNRMLLAYGDGRGLLLRATSSRSMASPRPR